MSFPQARAGDMHICNVPPGFTSPIMPPCCPTVLVMKMPAARMGCDMAMSGPVPPATPPAPHPFVTGSATVLIGGFPALRVTDKCALGGLVIPPCATTVLTGG
ncbi:MAG: PAAR domain-containing protein [Pseudomonadota bacterium]